MTFEEWLNSTIASKYLVKDFLKRMSPEDFERNCEIVARMAWDASRQNMTYKDI